MRKCAFFWMALVILAFQFGTLTSAQADAVGRMTQVEGRVDILRGGQLPAIPVKVNDGVQTGDVLRTKSMSKAQITFIDNSTLTVSPESRVSIEAYMFDSSQNKRNAVVQLFQGIAHVVVGKVLKAAEPDFVVKTHTAVMGVRGTDFGVRLHPNSTDILNFEGLLQVGNRLPIVSKLFRRAFKVAYSFGAGGGGGQQWVFLKTMQGSTVREGLPPSAVFEVTPAMKSSFMDLFNTLGSRGPGGGTVTGGGLTAGGGFPYVVGGLPSVGYTVPSSGFLGLTPPGTGAIIPLDATIAANPVGVVTPPLVVPTALAAPPPPTPPLPPPTTPTPSPTPPPPPPPPTPPLPPHPPR